MNLKQYILYFVWMFQSMNRIFIKINHLLDQIKLLMDQVYTYPYNIYYVIFLERKAIMEVIAIKLYVNI